MSTRNRQIAPVEIHSRFRPRNLRVKVREIFIQSGRNADCQGHATFSRMLFLSQSRLFKMKLSLKPDPVKSFVIDV